MSGIEILMTVFFCHEQWGIAKIDIRIIYWYQKRKLQNAHCMIFYSLKKKAPKPESVDANNTGYYLNFLLF